MIEKVFKAYDVRATYPNPLNEDAAWKVGHAAAQYLRRSRQINVEPRVKLEHTMVVGRDMRPHSPALAAALSDGIRSVGFDVIDVGMIDTPMLYFAINELSCVGGIQTTASYGPMQMNGFKISGPKAKPIGAASGLNDIKRITSTLRPGNTGLNGKYGERDLWPQYRKHVLKFLDLKRAVKVVIDAGNGMAGKMIPAIFDGVPHLEIIPILFDITGSFERESNPLIDANLKWVKEATIQHGADLGICFDGDADRCAFVDERGVTIGGDLIAALLARDFLAQPANKRGHIVYDLRSSEVVPEEISAGGGVPHRERVGHAFMMKAMTESKSVFGGELGGHFYFRDNFFADSGAIALARVLSVFSSQNKRLSELVAPLHRYSQSGEVNFVVDDRDAKIRELAELHKRARIDYLDGITIQTEDWWFNVRKSNADNLLRLNLEAQMPRLLEDKFADLKKILGEPIEKQ
jgi:phosphomannomutase